MKEAKEKGQSESANQLKGPKEDTEKNLEEEGQKMQGQEGIQD